MNCDVCGKKMIVIAGNKGVLIYCDYCSPGLDQAYFKALDESAQKR